MGIYYGFELDCEVADLAEGERIRAALLEHTDIWGGDEIKLLGPADGPWKHCWLNASGENKRSAGFDTAEDELAAAVRVVWRAAGRYVEVRAHVLYVEDTPSEGVYLGEDDYDLLREGGAS